MNRLTLVNLDSTMFNNTMSSNILYNVNCKHQVIVLQILMCPLYFFLFSLFPARLLPLVLLFRVAYFDLTVRKIKPSYSHLDHILKCKKKLKK